MAGRRSLRPKLREAAAMLTQARYFSRDLRPKVGHGEGPSVVLLHGLYASAGVWRPLRRRLERELDAGCHSLSYMPGPGVLSLSERVSDLVARIPSPAPIFLVGHSMGGLVMRYVASSDYCDRRVVQTVSLASPFLGSGRNWLVPGQAGRDLSPESPLLAKLRARTPHNERVPHVTLVAEDDEMIIPGAFPDYGQHVLIRHVGHNGILFHEEAIERVVRLVANTATSPPASR